MTASQPKMALECDEKQSAAPSISTLAESAHETTDLVPVEKHCEDALATRDQQDACDEVPISLNAALHAEDPDRHFVHPIAWTAIHLELLGARFEVMNPPDLPSTGGNAQAASDASGDPAPALTPPWLVGDGLAVAHVLVGCHTAETRMLALGVLMRVYGLVQVGTRRLRARVLMRFNEQTFCKLGVHGIWSSRTGDRMMLTINLDSISEKRRMRVLHGRNNTAGRAVRERKLEALQPAEAHQDPYIWSLLIALAQAQRQRAAAAVANDPEARWRVCLLALAGAHSRKIYYYRGCVSAAMLGKFDEPSAAVFCPKAAIEVGMIELTTEHEVAQRVWEVLRQGELV